MKNSKFIGSCEDAESLNLSEQSLGCELNSDEQNSLRERNCAASNLNDESSVEALNLNGQNSASALNLDNLNSKTTPNLNDQNLSNQSFAAIGIASTSNLDSENSVTGVAALNFKNKNSAATDAVAASKTMAGAAKTGSYNERRRSKNDKNSAKRY